jgi:hypothetical protein
MKMCFEEVEFEGDDVVRQIHDKLHLWALVSTVMNIRVP